MVGIGMSRQEQFSDALSLCCVAGIEWRRLVFYFEQPKFRIHEAVDDLRTPGEQRQVLDTLEEARIRCRRCVDRSFTQIWLRRFRNQALYLRARRSLRIHVAATPPSSVSVEKKHLLGQENKKLKARGRALTAMELV